MIIYPPRSTIFPGFDDRRLVYSITRRERCFRRILTRRARLKSMIGAAAPSSPKKRFADIQRRYRVPFFPIFSCIFASHFTHPSICISYEQYPRFLKCKRILPPLYSFLCSFLSFFSFFCFRFSLESRSFDNGFGTVFGRLIRTDAIVEQPRELSTSLTII